MVNNLRHDKDRNVKMTRQNFLNEVESLHKKLVEWERTADELLQSPNGDRAKMLDYDVAMARYDVLHAIRSLEIFLGKNSESEGSCDDHG